MNNSEPYDKLAEQLFRRRKLPGTVMGVLCFIFCCGGMWLELANQSGNGSYILWGVGLALLTEAVTLYFIFKIEKERLMEIEVTNPGFREYYRTWTSRKIKENIKKGLGTVGSFILIILKIATTNNKSND